MKARALTVPALLTAAALIIFVIELQLPRLIPVPGVKAGLSNIITVFALYRLGRRNTVLIVLARIVLGCLLAGSPTMLMYSLAGAALSLSVMLPLKGAIPAKYMYLTSIPGAAAHNAGQLLTAVLITRTSGLWLYFPVLLLTGTLAGAFTGLCALLLYRRIKL